MNPLQLERWLARNIFVRSGEINLADLYLGDLPNLSVTDEVAAGLKKRRWLAALRIEVPVWSIPLSEHAVVEYINARLKGRSPFFYFHDNYLDGHYSPDSGNDDARVQVDDFALHLALALSGLPTAVRAATVGAYTLGNAEGVMGPDHQLEPYRPDTP